MTERKRAREEYIEYLEGKTKLYRSEFRLKAKNNSWKWILSTEGVVERFTNRSGEKNNRSISIPAIIEKRKNPVQRRKE